MSDLIRREDVKKLLVNEGIYGYEWKIDALPSAERKGKWKMREDPFGYFDEIPVCSECGCTTKMREKTNYCPNCGAKMEEEK